MKIKSEKYLVDGTFDFQLEKFETTFNGNDLNKNFAKDIMKENIEKMRELQDRLYAFDKYALLLIFQAMDAAGKDGAIKHVMSGLNPQGTQVFSFKAPSQEELDHDYLWRINKALPERGRIGIFNRSHYEDVLIVRVHNLITKKKLPPSLQKQNIWTERFEQIRNFEKYLSDNGIIVLKFFLNLSKEEQKERFLERLEDPAKNWKFSSADVEERKYWDDYQKCYQDAISETATKYAPWYVIPADKKWYARLLVSDIVVKTLESLQLEYPLLNEEQMQEIEKYKIILKES